MILFRIPSYVVAMVITLKFVFGSLDYTIDTEANHIRGTRNIYDLSRNIAYTFRVD